MSTWKGFIEIHIMKEIKDMNAELWEPTRDGKAPRDKGQWEASPPQEMKGQMEGRQGMWYRPMEVRARHKNPVHTQVRVEPGGSNFLGNYHQVKVSSPQ